VRRLHLRHGLVLGLVPLGHEDRRRVVDHGLDESEQRQRVGLVVGVELGDRRQEERRQELVEGEVVLERVVDLDEAPVVVGSVELAHHLGLAQRLVEADRGPDVLALAGPGLVVVEQQRAQVLPRAPRPVEHRHEHPRRDGER